jgi:hypothetical protein
MLLLLLLLLLLLGLQAMAPPRCPSLSWWFQRAAVEQRGQQRAPARSRGCVGCVFMCDAAS